MLQVCRDRFRDVHFEILVLDPDPGEINLHPGIWCQGCGVVLAVYMDDLLMVALSKSEDKLWKNIVTKVFFDEESAPISKFLGVHHAVDKIGKVTALPVEMEDFLKHAGII